MVFHNRFMGHCISRRHEAINRFCVFKFLMRNWQSAFNKWREIRSRIRKLTGDTSRNLIIMEIFFHCRLIGGKKFLEIKKGKDEEF